MQVTGDINTLIQQMVGWLYKIRYTFSNEIWSDLIKLFWLFATQTTRITWMPYLCEENKFIIIQAIYPICVQLSLLRRTT